MIIQQAALKIIATAFAKGRTHDFRLFKKSQVKLAADILCLADPGYQGLVQLHANSETPQKKSPQQPLTTAQKQSNRALVRRRIFVEHVIGKLKIFRILSERYRNRCKQFSLHFDLITAIYNYELT